MIGNNVGGIRVGILGLGEAGRLLARDLVDGGAAVLAWDPEFRGDLSRIPLAPSFGQAVTDAAVVISVNWSSVAREVALQAAPVLAANAIFADHNTSAPRLKQDIAHIISAAGARFVDVAMMAPVPGLGMRVPMFVAGECAGDLARFYRQFGTPVEVVGATPGDAAARKLTRSIFFKGMAAAVCEALEAARAAGVEDWLRSDITRTFVGADGAMLDRIVAGTRRHAKRRAHEMHEAALLLQELGVDATMSSASALAHERIAAGALREPHGPIESATTGAMLTS